MWGGIPCIQGVSAAPSGHWFGGGCFGRSAGLSKSSLIVFLFSGIGSKTGAGCSEESGFEGLAVVEGFAGVAGLAGVEVFAVGFAGVEGSAGFAGVAFLVGFAGVAGPVDFAGFEGVARFFDA